MIKIKNIRVEEVNNNFRLIADITCPSFNNQLWFEVDKDNGKYLTYELADAFLVILLPLAIKNKWNIEIEKTPVSAVLYFNICTFFLPIVESSIKIIAETIDLTFEPLFVGTGMSCGVDSFYTLYQCYYNSVPAVKLNSVTFFNVGAHNGSTFWESRQLFLERSQKSSKIAQKLKMDFLLGDSNIHEVLNEKYLTIHTYRNIGFILALQKKYKIYYYSAGHIISEFEAPPKNIDDDSAKYDILLLSLFSNQNVSFYSSGVNATRLEKIKAISNLKIAQENLLVCFDEENNCGICEKCMRTIYAIWALNQLEKFNLSFDINLFNNNRKFLDFKFMSHVYNHEQSYMEIFLMIKKNNLNISIVNKLKGLIYHYIRDKILKRGR